MSSQKTKRSKERKVIADIVNNKMDGMKEKRWAAIVIVRGHGEVEYQFDSMDLRDAMSYLEDNVLEDYGVKIMMSNIKSLEEID